MSAMHHDTSYDLKVVGSKLKELLEVYIIFLLSPEKRIPENQRVPERRQKFPLCKKHLEFKFTSHTVYT